MSFTEGLNYIELPRNVFFEKTSEGGVRFVKYVGDSDDLASLRVMYEYTYSADHWSEITKAMAKKYVTPPPESDPGPEPPEPDVANGADALATVTGATPDVLSPDAG